MNDERERRGKRVGGGNAPHPCCATKGGALSNSLYLPPSLAYLRWKTRGQSAHSSDWLLALLKNSIKTEWPCEEVQPDFLSHKPARLFHRSAPDSHLSKGTPLHSFENCIIVKSQTRSGKRLWRWNRTAGRAPQQHHGELIWKCQWHNSTARPLLRALNVTSFGKVCKMKLTVALIFMPGKCVGSVAELVLEGTLYRICAF